jgi:hypothetical protein
MGLFVWDSILSRMLLGHYGVAFAAKRVSRGTSHVRTTKPKDEVGRWALWSPVGMRVAIDAVRTA